jgi:hypothetical protein
VTTFSSAAESDDPVAGYHPVSPLAVAAAVVGVASALALVSPMFWMVPVVGVAVAVAGLVDVGRRGAPKAGRLAALAGLGLALGFGSQALCAAGTAEWLARGRAEAAVRVWLEAIADGRLDAARSMCGPDAAAAVDRVVASGMAAVARVRCRGRDAAHGGPTVRVATAAGGFDVVLDVVPPRRSGEGERFTVARCEPLTPSAK